MSMHDHRQLSAYASTPSLRILVVENDVKIRQRVLLPALRKHGFDMYEAGTAAELYRHMLAQPFDIVVLDLHLPDESGLAVTRYLRAISNVGIVMFTDWHARHHHAQLLQAGADVCLPKPADGETLAATLLSLARRLSVRASPPAAIADAMMPPWQLADGGWRLVSPLGKAIALTASERSVLTMLVAEAGQPVSRDALLQVLNRGVQGFDPHRLEMMIHRLRKKALAQAGERLPLLTVRGVGYLLACDGNMPVA
jgi:DNA-binding response OmpR family regulator